MKEKRTSDQTLSELIGRAQAGEQRAFTELYRTTYSQLYRSIRAIVGSDSAAEDVLQEAYLKAFTQIESLRQAESFPLWMRRIAINEAKKYLLKKKTISFTELEPEETLPERLEESSGLNIEEACEQKETSLLVQRIVDTLPDEQRIVVVLYYYDELSVGEIAEQLSLPVGTVKFRLFSARSKLRRQIRQLEKRGIRLYQLTPLLWFRRLICRAAGAGTDTGLRVPPALLTGGKSVAASLTLSKLLVGGLALAVGAGGVFYAWRGSRAGKPPDYGDFRPTETQQYLQKGGRADETALQTEEPTQNETDGPAQTDATEWEHTISQKTVPEATEPEHTDPLRTEPEPVGPEETDSKPIEPEAALSGEGWRFEPESGALTVTGAQYSADAGGHAWRGQISDSEIRSLTITGTAQIGDSAFASMPALEQVTIEAPVESIGSYAFYRCRKLETVRLSDTLTQIGADAFNGCTALREIVFPDGLTALGDRSFAYCPALQSVSLPEGLTALGIYAFTDCTSLSDVQLPPSLRSVNTGAFKNCKALQQIVIPEGVAEIGASAFSGCSQLMQVRLPGSASLIGTQSFMDCVSLERIVFPEGVGQISWNAFLHCTTLKEIELPSSLECLGTSAFKDCPALQSVTVPASVALLENHCLGYLTGYERVEGFVLIGTPGTAAETYAAENQLTFQETP